MQDISCAVSRGQSGVVRPRVVRGSMALLGHHRPMLLDGVHGLQLSIHRATPAHGTRAAATVARSGVQRTKGLHSTLSRERSGRDSYASAPLSRERSGRSTYASTPLSRERSGRATYAPPPLSRERSVRAARASATAAGSTVTHADRDYMRQALELARRGLGKTYPNPAVGCVIVKDGKVVGEGFHPKAGEPHAEVFALRGAGREAAGATAYVTLEPCNHFGRTPPCSRALVDAGISRVVVGVVDPNPLVGGQGIATLVSAGIEVAQVGAQEEADCYAINADFMERMKAQAAS